MTKYIIDVIVHIHQEIITNNGDQTPHIDRTTNQTTEILHTQITITSNLADPKIETVFTVTNQDT